MADISEVEPSGRRPGGWRQRSFRWGGWTWRVGRASRLGTWGPSLPGRVLGPGAGTCCWSSAEASEAGVEWGRGEQEAGPRRELAEVAALRLAVSVFRHQLPRPRHPPPQSHPQCLISTGRGEFSLLRKRRAEQGGRGAFRSHLLCSWPAFLQLAPRKETAGGVPAFAVYWELSPHLQCFLLFPESQSRRSNGEAEESVFVVARFTGTAKVTHFIREKKREIAWNVP